MAFVLRTIKYYRLQPGLLYQKLNFVHTISKDFYFHSVILQKRYIPQHFFLCYASITVIFQYYILISPVNILSFKHCIVNDFSAFTLSSLTLSYAWLQYLKLATQNFLSTLHVFCIIRQFFREMRHELKSSWNPKVLSAYKRRKQKLSWGRVQCKKRPDVKIN